MGGQACVVYGSAEFSRDIDLAILADDGNLARITSALNELQATVIAVPPFERQYLEEGLAVHFRCQHPEAANFRLDLMSKMRGVADFAALWERRTSAQLDDGTSLEVLSLQDLVCAKKTQRDKDWPMVARLVEVHYQANQHQPTQDAIKFWLHELRSAARLIEVVAKYQAEAELVGVTRLPVHFALHADTDMTVSSLRDEEAAEREADRVYWAPLRLRLEQLRRQKRDASTSGDGTANS